MAYKFWVWSAKHRFEATPGKPSFILFPNNWDDYGSKSLYRLEYYDGSKTREIGDIKIIWKKSETAKLDPEFKTLDENYLSLGQSLDFYRDLRKAMGSREKAQDVLSALNDACLYPDTAAKFQHLSWYTNSLLRTNEAQLSFSLGGRVLQSRKPAADWSFNYDCEIPGADEAIRLSFNFDKADKAPGRMCALIGRNGVGKTSIMANMALDLTDLNETSGFLRDRRDKEKFEGNRPLFTRIMALSFSAFDEFERPVASDEISYIYCGAKDEDNRTTKSDLVKKHKTFFAKVQERKRMADWRDQVEFILGDDADVSAYEEFLSSNEERPPAGSLSSGQTMLIYCVTALLAYISPNTLILFDEPELHLHPNAVAQLMAILHDLTKEYDCYAILATHSALVIQDIPGKRVQKLVRHGNLTSAKELGRETFGEDLALLNEEVFETANVEYHYKHILKRLHRTKTVDEIVQLFDGRLGFHAMMYLESLEAAAEAKS